MSRDLEEFKNEDGVCYKCGSSNIEKEPMEVLSGGENVAYSYACNDCKAEGEHIFYLEHSENVKKEK